MKNILLAFMAIFALFTFTGCTRVPTGHVGVKVYLLGSEKGVDHEVLGVGRYWIGINEELHLFPTFEQNPKYTASKEDDFGKEVEFQVMGGMIANADFSVTYLIEQQNVSKVFQKYRRGVDEINRGPLYNILRDAVTDVTSKLEIESVYGEGKSQMMASIEEAVKAAAADSGITVKNVSLLGPVRLPPSQTASINEKMQATQRAQQRENELREAQAQAAKDVAAAEGRAKAMLAEREAEAKAILIQAQAQAEANALLNRSLTPALVEVKRIEKWNGTVPQVSSGSTPIIDLR